MAGDLRAVVASAGLKLRELWRRNREGDLSAPGFWPVSLAPLFWPLLLALGLAVLLALGVSLARGLARPSLQAVEPPASQSVQQPVQQPVQRAGQQRQQSPLQPPVPTQIRPLSEAQSQAQAQTQTQGQTQPSPEPILELDPLLALLADDDPQACIAFARPDPQASRLDLEMAAAYQALPAERRQHLADHWLQRSRELGYERLRLLDGSGLVLGQAARVGSGMVLLESSPAPQA